MNRRATPSAARGIDVTPRLPDFVFDPAGVPEDWFAGDTGRTAAWSALSVIAGTAETGFAQTGRWLVERMDDPALADETLRFVQQEVFHGAVHARFNRVLAARGRPVAAVEAMMKDLLADVEACGGRPAFLAAMLAAEQVIGEFGHALLTRPEVFDGMPETIRSLWMWHAYEEVEHAAALHDGFTHVFGETEAARDLRVLGAVYILVLLVVAWPAAAWVMVPPASASARRRASTWTPVVQQLFGRDGLLRGVGRNLAALRRVDFHPFDLRDPAPLLAAWRDRLVAEAWERDLKRGEEVAGRSPRPEVVGPGARDWVGVGRFAARAAARAVRLVRDRAVAEAG